MKTDYREYFHHFHILCKASYVERNKGKAVLELRHSALETKLMGGQIHA
jgi:hypothetical protein